jgi:hypothetical protein
MNVFPFGSKRNSQSTTKTNRNINRLKQTHQSADAAIGTSDHKPVVAVFDAAIFDRPSAWVDGDGTVELSVSRVRKLLSLVLSSIVFLIFFYLFDVAIFDRPSACADGDGIVELSVSHFPFLRRIVFFLLSMFSTHRL